MGSRLLPNVQRRLVSLDVAIRKVGGSNVMRGEGQGGGPGFELAIGARLVNEAALQAESLLEEMERGFNARDVDDGVAELHVRPSGERCR
jgi:hypothetical protein